MRLSLKNIKIAAFILLLAVLSSTAVGGYEKGKDKAKGKDDIYSQLELFADAISLIRSDYVEDVDSKKLIYGAMRGMVSSLDDYSQFMDPEEFNEIKVETKGEFGGIGIEISSRDGILTIITPIVGTPAEAAGIKPGDKIIKIDGVIAKNMSLNDSIKKLRGKAGTLVKLTIWREKEEKVLDVAIKRAIIKIHSIKKSELIEDKIGYIRLVEFQENTPRDLEEALGKLESQGLDALILDLRYNPGGLLEGAVDVSERFIAGDKVIVSIKSRDPGQSMVFKSSGKFLHPDYPLIILVNEGSASASEIVAGAVQDNKRGIVLGTKTFGKASVQSVISLKDGSALRITSALYYTPSGKLIKGLGIMPDVVVEREEMKTGKGKDEDKDEREEIFEKAETKSVKFVKEPGKEEKDARDNQLNMAVSLIKAMKIYKSVKP